MPRRSSTASTCSCFGGSSGATSSFVRRRMSGRMRRRSRSRRSAFPSCSMGRRYRSSNARRDGNRPGATSCRIAHSSPRLFSIGVPVTARRNGARMPRAASCTFVAAFFTNCASSSTSPPHSSAANAAASRRSTAYVVTTRSADAAASAMRPRRLASVAVTVATRRPGVNRAASLTQFEATEVGRDDEERAAAARRRRRRPASVACCSTVCAISASVCAVLPSPMSSARTPPRRLAHRNASHRKPASW